MQVNELQPSDHRSALDLQPVNFPPYLKEALPLRLGHFVLQIAVLPSDRNQQKAQL